jgi:hypothetical protein
MSNEVVLIDTPYCPDAGNFARTRKIIEEKYKIDNWFYCRDLFHNVLWNLKIFFFSHNWNRGSSVAAFMKKIEDILDVEPRSQFGPTQIRRIMWVKPSIWWIKHGMRRSLFTILLRVGVKYVVSKDNFDEIIKSEKYLQQTYYAFERFMSGNTKYTGHKRGWYKQFCEINMANDAIDKLLIVPKNNFDGIDKNNSSLRKKTE